MTPEPRHPPRKYPRVRLCAGLTAILIWPREEAAGKAGATSGIYQERQVRRLHRTLDNHREEP